MEWLNTFAASGVSVCWIVLRPALICNQEFIRRKSLKRRSRLSSGPLRKRKDATPVFDLMGEELGRGGIQIWGGEIGEDGIGFESRSKL